MHPTKPDNRLRMSAVRHRCRRIVTLCTFVSLASITAAAGDPPVLRPVASFGPAKSAPDFTFAAEFSSPPYESLDAQGRPQGFTVEVLRSAAARGGFRIDVLAGTWSDVLANLEAGRVDLTAMTQTKARLTRFSWINDLVESRSVVLVPADRRDPPQSLADLSRETIAVKEKSMLQEVLAGLPEPPHLLLMPNIEAAMTALKEGRASGVAANDVTARRWVIDSGMTRFIELPIKLHNYGIVVRRGREAHASALAATLADMTDRGVIRQYEERYLALPTPPLDWRAVAPWAIGVAMLIVMTVGGVLLWNASLRRQVQLRTVALEQAMQRADAVRAQTQQAQKMEAIGRLAGGVAHDFNNMLTVILGQAELALAHVDVQSRLGTALSHIQRAGQHSADLTRQLLGFARRQTVSPRVLDLNGTVAGMLKMLRRLIGENIQLEFRPGLPRVSVHIDPVQIDQILANLCVNARDAIDGTGTVTISTGEMTFDESYCVAHVDYMPGRFSRLSVTDSGSGMDAALLDHIFEPFFTTKGVGEGTGLGLATVFGIVKQNEGFMTVRSAPGRGTTFDVYLPCVNGTAELASTIASGEAPRGRGETILLVEDEPAVLEVAQNMLELLGYRVLTAGTPREAVHVAAQHAATIDLLVTDIVMPEMDGRTLARDLSQLMPRLRCLLVSGYARGDDFLQKPYSIGALAHHVRRLLDDPVPA